MGRVIRGDQGSPSPEVIDEAVAVLLFGGVVVLPTDSVYGIGCAATPGNPAHLRIFQIKERPLGMTLPWLVADASDLARFSAEVSPAALALATAFWPGALTLVVCASDEVPPEYRGADGTIALRLPDSALVRAVARRVGVPLATTSANTHGMDAATSGASVEDNIVAAADLTIDAGPAPISVASTIVDVTGPSAKILRVGAISPERILSALR